MEAMGSQRAAEPAGTAGRWDRAARGYPVSPGLSAHGAGALAGGADAVRTVHLLGSTGSIGTQTADIVRANPSKFRVTGLAARAADGASLTKLLEQVAQLQPDVVAVADVTAADAVRQASPGVEVIVGPDAAAQLAQRPVDVSLNALAGAAGLPCTVAALAAGSVVALANKESLVVGGALVTSLAGAGQLVPVDSEHSALAQCLWAGTRDEVARLVLTEIGRAHV